MTAKTGLIGDFTAQFVVDMGAYNLVERLLGLKAERRRALGIEPFRPAGDDADDQFVRLAAGRRKPTADRGLACVCRTVSATGRIASIPAKGSRMMPEKKPDAALFGLPGRTQIVGRRMPTPSRKPRRV